ncbi:MAG: phosphatidylserine decarboxylase family protein [Prevotella sp.]|jgi:phosphatidylserine decarboxylase|nr:phosphatidylserine decarboxylase family protein [Prevotella sp.]MCI7313553.1 phosphatidylserine decarboxylase family protein [Prevotella sp.]MDD7708056.1 phosphatidylserine decarboxylase family protein [Prevotella sp.]MDY4150111.1 phosphatidylserine decarboxylase family protein [Prevotella sp.]
MGNRIKKIKKIRIHREGTDTLLYGLMGIIAVAIVLWQSFDNKIPFWLFVAVFGTVYAIVLNFYRCPIRYYGSEDTEKIVVAPADGKIVVIEEVEENTYFHDRRLMISIFMSLFNVHANWFPVDGKVKFVKHFDGNYHKAWLPKASEENEHADIMITTPDGVDVLCRQIAGAVARRIVTYAKDGEDCYIDEHLGFIKLGSRVDVFLPIGTEVCVKMGQATTGDLTVIAKLK